MRELTQEETAALMAERKADIMRRLREEHPHLDILDKAGRVPATVTRKGPVLLGQGGDGYRFAQIIQKAAGLDGFRLRSIECRVAGKEAITFKAEIMGTAEDIAAAIAANEDEPFKGYNETGNKEAE